MRSINVYEVGVDSLPLPGLEINWWERRSSFSFVDDEMHSGVVVAGIPEGQVYDPVAIVTKEFDYDCPDMFDDYGMPLKQYLYIEDPDNHIYDGMKWMYTHEYMDAIGADVDVFPFQHSEQFMATIKYGMVELISHFVDVRPMKEDGDKFDYYFHSYEVKYKDVVWLVKFGSLREDEPDHRCFETTIVEEIK